MPNTSKIVVLIADDEPSTVAMLSSHLRSKGYAVLEASDGDQAWELAHEHLPHLVILDVMMPGISGYDALKLIKDKFESPPPVVVYSAVDGVDEKVKGKETRDYTYVVKTPSGSLLFEAVQAALAACGRKILN